MTRTEAVTRAHELGHDLGAWGLVNPDTLTIAARCRTPECGAYALLSCSDAWGHALGQLCPPLAANVTRAVGVLDAIYARLAVAS